MSRFVNPFPQFCQVVSGYLQPVSNGRLYFYVNGTSDLADIFTDAALTIPADNYQPLDGEGRMTQNVFIGTSVYRVRLADSNNATIWDKSNVTVADTAEIDGLIAELEALIASVSSDLFSENYAANGGMSVDNLDTAGTPVTLSTSYQNTVTGYASAILTNYSAGTAKQSTVQIGESGYSLAYLGVTCTSAGVPALRYRIASADAISLTGKTLTLSLVVNHNVGASINYTIATYVANAKDNFAAVTSTGLTSVTSVPTGTDTTISLTSAFGNVTNGLEVIVSCAPNQAITTKNFYWSDVQCNISGVLLPFRPPIYREEQFRQIDPSTLATDAEVTAAITAAAKVRQVVKSTTTTAAQYSTYIPIGGTIPQNTEGTEVLTVTITPTAADSVLEIDAVAFCASQSGEIVVGALFVDSTADALDACGAFTSSIGCQPVPLRYYVVAGSTSARTYKFRVGTYFSGRDWFLNRDLTYANVFGSGKVTSSLIVREYAP